MCIFHSSNDIFHLSFAVKAMRKSREGQLNCLVEFYNFKLKQNYLQNFFILFKVFSSFFNLFKTAHPLSLPHNFPST